MKQCRIFVYLLVSLLAAILALGWICHAMACDECQDKSPVTDTKKIPVTDGEMMNYPMDDNHDEIS